MIDFFGVPFDEFARSTEALASVDPRVIKALVRNAATRNNLNNIEEIVAQAQVQAKEFTSHLQGLRSLVSLVETPPPPPMCAKVNPPKEEEEEKAYTQDPGYARSPSHKTREHLIAYLKEHGKTSVDVLSEYMERVHGISRRNVRQGCINAKGLIQTERNGHDIFYSIKGSKKKESPGKVKTRASSPADPFSDPTLAKVDQLILFLLQADRPMSRNEIEKELGVSPASIKWVFRDLVARGYAVILKGEGGNAVARLNLNHPKIVMLSALRGTGTVPSSLVDDDRKQNTAAPLPKPHNNGGSPPVKYLGPGQYNV